MTDRPLPLARATAAELSKAAALCFDLDDTFTTSGRVRPEAFRALWAAHDAGLPAVLVTGRPAGWCDHLCRMWPVAGVVGENGAFYFAYDPTRRRVVRRWARPQARRAEDRRRLDAVAEAVLARVPRARIAADQAFRAADLAIDFAEDAGPLSKAEVARIVEVFREHGATAKVSSIHVNGYFGRYDKAGMLLRLARERLGLDRAAARARLAYVGDSPNDAPLFAAFDLTFGVASVRRVLDDLEVPPRWIARGDGGRGFAEVTRRLIRARGRPGRSPSAPPRSG